ncbi:putative RAB GTPase-activating protein [Paragonimus heterotremus]|uniref:Putative RAB GTPase-activating protein n=1 Tax=Paragonimus heterotremus TaxID=100268 RepID=A0A8J4SV37_9TREM|nr:putative RAB GTPase-activating protein [Paragonimus heterotremus]
MIMREEECSEIDRYGFFSGEQFCGAHSPYSQASLEQLRKRELKWLDMLEEWDRWMQRQPWRVRKRCRKGIPSSLRARAWQYLSGSHRLLLANRGKYESLLSSPGSTELIEQIRRDVYRQFPNHSIFIQERGTGQESLFNILKAYCLLYPETGYCQAHAPLAAALLIHMPEEEAFWTFICICEHYLPDYFKQGLVRVKTELKMFAALLAKYHPKIHSHLLQHNVEPIFFAIDWFMCLFTRNLPWSSVLRILDMFFFEGVKVIFRTALALLDLILGSAEKRIRLDSTDSLLTVLRRLPGELTDEKVLISRMLSYKHVGTTPQLIAEYQRQIKYVSMQ